MVENTSVPCWPGWETVRVIGKGSFGAVYEIQRNMFGECESAALKVISIPRNKNEIESLRNDGFDEESITHTFYNHMQSIVDEYSLMRKFNGVSNVVNCDDVLWIQHDDGIGWDVLIKMELLTPLVKVLPTNIPESMVIRVAADLSRALVICANHKIVHRDIKPQNIFLSPNGDYKLGDFGVSKTIAATTQGTLTGTYKYMAPEVYHHQPYGASADIYSLGLVLYWMLNKRRMPFLPPSPTRLSVAMENEAQDQRMAGVQIPAPADGSPELKRIVLKALAFDPGDRYHTAAEMLEDLEQIAHNEAHLQQMSDSDTVRQAKSAPDQQPMDATVREKLNSEVVNRKKKSFPLGVFAAVIFAILTIGGLAIFYLGSFGAPFKSVEQPSVMDATSDTSEVTIMRHEGGLFWGQQRYARNSISFITFYDSVDKLGENAWDVSEKQNGAVWAWVEDGNHLCVAANGKITPGSDASDFFADFNNLQTISFNGAFGTSGVTNMSRMFSGCSKLSTLDLSGFDTSSVTDMSRMFNECSALQGVDLSGFDTSGVTDMSRMFNECSSLQNVNLSGFDTSNVMDMSGMFAHCGAVRSLDLSGFNTSSVENLSNMFYFCRSLESMDLSNFQTKKAADITKMFAGCLSLKELDISGFQTTPSADISDLFNSCQELSDLSCRDIRILADRSIFTLRRYVFAEVGSKFSRGNIKTIYYHNSTDQAVEDAWDGSALGDGSILLWTENDTTLHIAADGKIAPHPDDSELFSKFYNLRTIEWNHAFDTSAVTNMSGMFSECKSLQTLDLSEFDTSNVTDMSFMFNSCESLRALDLSEFDTSNVTDMSLMFSGCESLTRLNLSNFDTSGVTKMDAMFQSCSSLGSLDLSSFNTAMVTDMSFMFSSCNALQSLDLSAFDTSGVTSMNCMFQCCKSLRSIELSNLNTSKVTTMEGMFAQCNAMQVLDVSGFDTSEVTNMEMMFWQCFGLQSLDLSSFNTVKVKTMSSMFALCRQLRSLDLSSFHTKDSTDLSGMFTSCRNMSDLKCEDSGILKEYQKKPLRMLN